MDERLFDQLARLSAASANRRRMAQAVAAALLGGAFTGARARPARGQGVGVCRQDSDCTTGENDPCSGARCDGGACTYFIVTCIPGTVCCGNGECCPASAPCLSDADCVDGDADPCTGAACENGTCVPYILTCVEGFVCCDGECVMHCDDGGIGTPPGAMDDTVCPSSA